MNTIASLQTILGDRYQLIQPLGQNVVRQTWLAIAAATHTPVTLKLLTFSGSVQWDDLKLFEREAKILQQLTHPQIPQYVDYFTVDEKVLWFCLVENYIEGASLKELLAQGRRFTETEAIWVAQEILSILIYLHELNPLIIHRDIKPSNIIWGIDNTIYLIDFGAVQDKVAATAGTFTITGTYGYAPLEQFSGRTVPASDLYGLGMTLIHLLTGVSPSELPIRRMRVCFQERVSVSQWFSRWLAKLTEPAIESRYRTAREALGVLNQIQTASSPAPVELDVVRGAKLPSPIRTPIFLIQDTATDRLEINIPSRTATPDPNPVGSILDFLGASEAQPSLYIQAIFRRDTFQISERPSPYQLLEPIVLTGQTATIRHIYPIGTHRLHMAVAIETTEGICKLGFSRLIMNGQRGQFVSHILNSDEALWLTQELHTWLKVGPWQRDRP